PPGRMFVWAIAENRVVRDLKTSPTFIATAISVAPDGKRVAAGQVNGELSVINLAGGAPIVLDHGAMPMTLNWTPDGKRIISTGIGVCKVWELSGETPLTTHLLNTEKHGRPISRFALSPDGRSIAIEQGRAAVVELFNLQSGERTKQFETGRRGIMPGSWLVFNPGGNSIVYAGSGGIRIWDARGDGVPQSVDEKKVFKSNRVTSLGFRGDGTLLLAGSDENGPAVKDALSGEQIWRLRDQQRRTLPRISRDGSLVAFYAEEKLRDGSLTIEVCRLPGGDVVHRIPSTRKEFTFQTGVDISPDNRWLIEIELAVNLEIGGNPLNQSPRINVAGSTDESWKAVLWNLETGEQHCQIKGHSKPERMVFSPDGRYFAIAQRNGNLVLWDIEGKERVLEWQAWEDAPEGVVSIRELVFTADSRKLAMAAEMGTGIRMLDLEKLNEELAEFGLGW
ncbi:MAG: WD40 repeat domain-containing protein, partial [Planctomycetes bacterium]|nr:WD40 repeat domain-containing protein [Planctomycetota bacterium]